ncbi:MAG: hypothetical protein DWQ37_00510 [Planctomycetota bacterium]|nr:MAG: hypothetical protein DWQ37_00510 [Planctomycetota bacterium]
MEPATIALLLQSGGWKEREIAAAIASHELEMPIPQRTGIGSARDAFFHLLAFTALYAATISLILLVFAYIEFAFPDPVERIEAYRIDSALSGIRMGLATLIVSYPTFVLVWGYLLLAVKRAPEKAQSGIRRWLTYLTLFVGAVTILGDVITVVFFLVEGDLTVRFLLKVLALFAITGAVFVYLSLTLRSEGEDAV